MGSRALRDALRDLAVEAGKLLARELDEGAQLPFEVVEEEGAGAVLYRYRALTRVFVDDRWEAVRALDAFQPASAAIRPVAAAYLRGRGRAGSSPDDALRDLVGRLFDDATTFEIPEDRFGQLAAELDAATETGPRTAIVMAPLHGVRLASASVVVGNGARLARRAVVDPPPAALGESVNAESTSVAQEDAPETSEGSPLDIYCLLERPLAAGAPLPVDEARVVFRRVLAALRLCGAGGTALGPLAWARAAGGAWHPVALGSSPRARPESWELRAGDEPELRELLEVLSRSRHGAPVAWALERFEMGCERGLETEALSDHLLAFRALFAAPGGDPAGIAQRVAVLCAVEPERAAVRQQIELAFALERQLILRGLDYGEAMSLDSPRRVVREVERLLRALLRDLLCGYLDEDLPRVADDALARAGSPPDGDEPLIRDARAPESDTEELAVTPSMDWAGAPG